MSFAAAFLSSSRTRTNHDSAEGVAVPCPVLPSNIFDDARRPALQPAPGPAANPVCGPRSRSLHGCSTGSIQREIARRAPRVDSSCSPLMEPTPVVAAHTWKFSRQRVVPWPQLPIWLRTTGPPAFIAAPWLDPAPKDPWPCAASVVCSRLKRDSCDGGRGKKRAHDGRRLLHPVLRRQPVCGEKIQCCRTCHGLCAQPRGE